jgi:hypothetical protein
MTVRAGALVVSLVLAACQSSGQPGDSLDHWVAANSVNEESLVCKHEANGEYFFVARAGDDGLRLGSRLDMSVYRESHSFTIGWRLMNGRGEYVTAKVKPTVVKNDYVKIGDKAYADDVQYQRFRTGTNKLIVELEVEKCPYRSCDSQDRQAVAKKYRLHICSISL